MTIQYHTTLEGVGIKKVIKALTNAKDTLVGVKYKLNKPTKEKQDDLVFDAAEEIRSMSASELMDETLEETLCELYTKAKTTNVREEEYNVLRDPNGALAINEAGYILFKTNIEIKSVLPLNIISVTVDGIKYVR